jgi:hypothetical protein
LTKTNPRRLAADNQAFLEILVRLCDVAQTNAKQPRHSNAFRRAVSVINGGDKMKHLSRCFVPALASVALSWAAPAEAASHRSAPIVALDPVVNNTDVYAFVSYDAGNLARTENNRRVTFISNYIPGQDPSDGPNYFNFGESVRYRINIDNNQDGIATDVVYEFRFTTENRPVGGPGGLTSPVPYLGNPHIPTTVPLQGITALDGPGSEG